MSTHPLYLSLCIGSTKFATSVYFFIQSRNFKCSFVNAKDSYYRSLNAIFGKIGRVAPVHVVLELVAKKCLPILLYRLEACPLDKADRSSLDFMINRFLMKLFNTGNIAVVEEFYFGFETPSIQLASKTGKFIRRFDETENIYVSCPYIFLDCEIM